MDFIAEAVNQTNITLTPNVYSLSGLELSNMSDLKLTAKYVAILTLKLAVLVALLSFAIAQYQTRKLKLYYSEKNNLMKSFVK